MGMKSRTKVTRPERTVVGNVCDAAYGEASKTFQKKVPSWNRKLKRAQKILELIGRNWDHEDSDGNAVQSQVEHNPDSCRRCIAIDGFGMLGRIEPAFVNPDPPFSFLISHRP